MSNGKLKVIGAIFKLDKAFRPPNIVDMTGLDRQLVRYHLGVFTERGFLEKIDKYYVLKDKEGLYDEMLNVTEATELSRMEPAGFVNKDTAAYLNGLAESVIWARVLDLPDSQEAKEAMLKQIDSTLKEWTRLRRFLTSSQRSKNVSAKKLNKLPLDELYKTWAERLRFTPLMTTDEWRRAAQEIIEDEIENEDA